MIFSKTCAYGLQALVYLALQEKRKFVTVKEISDSLNISFHFLAKILHSLSHHQILISHRGAQGGVALARSADSITLMDIVEALGETQIFTECVFGFNCCNHTKPCCLHEYWEESLAHLNSVFNRTRLSDAANKIRDNDLYDLSYFHSSSENQA